MKKYQIIYADPPWSYNDKMTGHSFSLDHEYQTQDLQWIKDLKVGELSDKNCCLFLWAVSPLLPEALQVIESWGFKFKTVAFIWSKKTKTGIPVSNLGKWTMGNVEICLLGVKGKPQRISKNVKQLVEDLREEHSKKPDSIRKRIVELMGDIPRGKIKIMFKDNQEGQTHYFGDNCGMSEHNKVKKECCETCIMYPSLGNFKGFSKEPVCRFDYKNCSCHQKPKDILSDPKIINQAAQMANEEQRKVSWHGDKPCGDCGTEKNPVWFTDNTLWNAVLEEEIGQILCISCFILRAEKKYDILRWRVIPNSELRTKL